jgi:hypothetical protein
MEGKIEYVVIDGQDVGLNGGGCIKRIREEIQGGTARTEG